MVTSAVFVQQATDRIRLCFISTCKWNISHDKSSSYSWEVIKVSVFRCNVMKHLLVGSTQLLDIHGMVLTETLERYSGLLCFLRLAHIAMLKYYVALTNTFASPRSVKCSQNSTLSQQSLCSANAKVGSLCQTQGAQEQQRLLQDLSHGWQVSFSGGVKQHLWNLRKKSLRENQCDNLCFKIPNLFSDDHQERPTSCVLPPSSHQWWLLLKSCHQYCQSSHSLHASFYPPDILRK